jgi:hypothetical protein
VVELPEPVELAGQPQIDERLDPGRTEDAPEDAAGRVVIVDVVDQVAQHHELARLASHLAQAGDIAVDIGDELQAHPTTVGVSG